MIDVNKITSTLAKLPDQQLQQYAQIHKSDPYIMALAMSESNRRKEMRAAGQGAQGMQEQPKVVDQMVASMAPQQLPEDQGIARIPAGDMNFAGGGIVAFADGGDVERYSGQFGSLTGDIPGFVAGTGNFIPQAGAPEELPWLQRQMAAAREDQRLRMLGMARERVATGRGTEADRAALADEQRKADVFAPPTRRADYETPALTAATAAPAPKETPAPTAKRGAATRPAAAEPAAKPDTGGLDTLIKNFTRETDLAQGALRNQRVGLTSQLEQEAKGMQEEGEKRRKERGDVFAGKEARLAEREKGLAGMKDQNLGLALLQAGAAMMSTPGNIGMAIGKGVQVGSERYVAGIDKINAAKDRFADARDRLEALRINRDDMNEKDIRDEQRAIRTARLQGQQLMLDGATNDLKMSAEQQKTVLGLAAESLLTDKRIQGQKDTARISASQPNAQMQIATALGNGNLEAGLRKMAEIQAGKFSVSNSYADYLKAFAGKETLSPPLSFANYAAQFGATLPR